MHVRRALAAAALPLLLAACSESDAEPKMPDPSPSSSSSTPTAEPTQEQESPEEFIRRWQAAGDEMQVTGDTSEYSAMSPRCKACQGFVDSVEEVYSAGGSAEFAGTKILSIRRFATRPPTFDVAMDVPETIIRHGDGRGVERLPAGRTKIRVILEKVADEWRVTYFGIL